MSDVNTEDTAGPSQQKVLSPEARERIERNRLAAKRKLLEKSGAVQEVLAAYKIRDGIENNTCQPSGSEPKVKKTKSAREQMLDNDIQNAVSKGTIVRIQGTKLIDTGGGFLLEEKDLTIPEEEDIQVVKEPAAIVPSDVPNCDECGKPFVESFLLKSFNHPVCDSCKYVNSWKRNTTKNSLCCML